MTRRALFVVPPHDAPVSGGNRYNEGLLSHLEGEVDRCQLAALDARTLHDRAVVWVDSLYFDRLLPLRRHLPPAAALHLIAHSLPSQLFDASRDPHAESARREARQREDLVATERSTLAVLAGALAPSETMRRWLVEAGANCPIHTLEPAVESALATRTHEGPLRALMVANLLPNKGVLPLLQALHHRLASSRSAPPFELRIVGAHDADPRYARACLAELEAHPVLQSVVRLLGPLPYATLAHELGAAHVLLSASRVESFGMAIADARAAGNIVLARRGGHVATLVQADSGGLLCDDDTELAATLLHLATNPAERRRRQALAESHSLPARSWAEVAAEFRKLCT